MKSSTAATLRQFSRGLVVSVLVPLLGVPQSLPAQTHIVSPADLQSAAVAATAARQHNLETITGFLSSGPINRVMTSSGIDPVQVKIAIASLTDEELARVAVRSEKIQTDFAAGRIGDRDLILIILGLVALILIIVAVR